MQQEAPAVAAAAGFRLLVPGEEMVAHQCPRRRGWWWWQRRLLLLQIIS